MKKCIHPIKAQRLMSAFVTEASTHTHTVIDMIDVDNLKWASHQEKTSVTIKRSDKCCIYTSFDDCYIDHEELTIYMDREIFKDYNSCYDGKGSRQFMSNFVSRFPYGKGFSHVTLTLLHELGHLECIKEDCHYDDALDKRMEFLDIIKTHVPKKYQNLLYFLLPEEQHATNWAGEWLRNPENRKKAKAFEKEFFKCYKDE